MSPRRPAVLRHTNDDTSLRDHLVATAARLIDQRGTANLTVRDIAHEAKVADGVLYNHFADKEELLADALLFHVATVTKSIGPVPEAGSGTVSQNLSTLITQALHALARIVPVFASLMSEPGVIARFHHLPGAASHQREIPAVLAAYLRAEQGLGRIGPNADTNAAAAMLIGACHELVLPRLLLGSTGVKLEVPPGFVSGIVLTTMQGIGPHAA